VWRLALEASVDVQHRECRLDQFGGSQVEPRQSRPAQEHDYSVIINTVYQPAKVSTSLRENRTRNMRSQARAKARKGEERTRPRHRSVSIIRHLAFSLPLSFFPELDSPSIILPNQLRLFSTFCDLPVIVVDDGPGPGRVGVEGELARGVAATEEEVVESEERESEMSRAGMAVGTGEGQAEVPLVGMGELRS
jgi:hypothetical protein